MSEAFIRLNAKQEFEAAYDRMMKAYDNYYRSGENCESLKIYYQTQLNNYRDLCTIIVERIMRSNPEILEEMTLLWLA